MTIYLRPYQETAVRFLLERNGGILADEQGLGKTISALAFARCMLHLNRCDKILILVPATLLLNWRTEIERFFRKYCVYYGSSRRLDDSAVILTSYNLFISNRGQFADFFAKDRLCVVLDEAHAIRNPASRLATALLTFKIESRLAITGTPIPNRPEDGYGIVRFVSPVLAGEYADWISRYCKVRNVRVKTRWGFKMIPKVYGYQNLDHLNTLLSTIMLRRLKSEVEDLPTKTVQYLPYQADMRQYLDAVDLLALNEEGLLAKLSRLQAVLSGLEPYERLQFEETEKYRLLRDIVSRREGPMIIWFQHVETLQWVTAYLERDLKCQTFTYTGQNMEFRYENVESWRKSKYGILAATIKAANVGNTWTESAHAVFYEQSLSPSENIQAEDRIHRIGQKNKCLIQYLYAPGTVEEAIVRYVHQKKQLIDAVVEEYNPVLLEEVYGKALHLKV